MVSIVLPVYNGEKYLASAIESVRAQTISDWELLVVNDGSKDDTSTICDEYAAQDSRIKVFHQQNGGVNSARARGIANAIGEYLTFLDADDTFSSDAIERMLDGFSDIVDVVYCGKFNLHLSQEEYILALWGGKMKLGICTKMFKTELFKGLEYSLDRRLAMGEDLLLNSMYALNIKGAQSICNHCYRINKHNDQSATKTFKHNWEYEKFYFNKIDELFLNKCLTFDCYEDIRLLVNKCWLNAMKYVMLDGGRINYKDKEFIAVQDFFKDRMKELGPSEKLIFKLRNAFAYRTVIKTYLRFK